MSIARRTFLKTSLATTAALASGIAQTVPGGVSREFYELRCYRMDAGSRLSVPPDPALLETFLEKAFVPALAGLGLNTVGVFSEIEVDKKLATSKPKPNSPIWVLIPYPNLETFVTVSAELAGDAQLAQLGPAYVNTPKSKPAFERIDAWLLLAFKGFPQLVLPSFSRDRVPTRVFEMRDYESHSEERAFNKVAMFDEGEIEIMKDLGMSPVFFGQALSGPNLPHLRYFTSGPSLEAHLENWKKFPPDPRWMKMKNLPQYADNTSLNTARFLVPKPYSSI